MDQLRHGKKVRLAIREAADFAGYRVYVFLSDDDGRITHRAKPIAVEFEPIDDGGGAFMLPEPTFRLGYQLVKRDRIFDAFREALVEAGLEKDHRGLEGELRATKEHVTDLSTLAKMLADVSSRCHRCV